jgi:hypothetical protein
MDGACSKNGMVQVGKHEYKRDHLEDGYDDIRMNLREKKRRV